MVASEPLPPFENAPHILRGVFKTHSELSERARTDGFVSHLYTPTHHPFAIAGFYEFDIVESQLNI